MLVNQLLITHCYEHKLCDVFMGSDLSLGFSHVAAVLLSQKITNIKMALFVKIYLKCSIKCRAVGKQRGGISDSFRLSALALSLCFL